MRLLRRLLCLSLPLLALALGGCTGTETNAKISADLAEALNYASIGRTNQAKYWTNQAIAVNPTALTTYVTTSTDPDDQPDLTIAAVFSTAGDNATLRQYMQQGIAHFPNNWNLYQVLVQADSALGDTTAQHADATKLAALLEAKIGAPGQTHGDMLTMALAQAYCDAGNLAKGVADYQKVIQAFPKEWGPYNNLAYAWAVADSKPNLPQALTYAQKAVSLAQAEASNGSVSEDQADSDVAAAQDTLGWVQYRMGDDQDAVANLEMVISQEPRLAETHYHLGMAYLALNEPDAARAALEHAAQLEPGYAQAEAALAPLEKSAPTAAVASGVSG